ncbi:hypothetical protein KKG22_00025 [Patescibacteria group bacterium]|nr:hypothetical protein [Patescibacteria group bacterium]MBU1721377.1 hypothetical protein [Patescibacteria group bacterium]MBU1900914.1 hypothetical protein [Patescibacteria group bacterium]
MPVSSSIDLLYIVLSICIVWFTVFLCWLLYQAARVLKNANDIIETITMKLELINEAVQYMRTKIDTVSKNMGVVSSMMGGVVEKFVVGKIADKLDEKVAGIKKKTTQKRKTAKK